MRIAGHLVCWHLHFSKLYIHYQETINRECNVRIFFFVDCMLHIIAFKYCSTSLKAEVVHFSKWHVFIKLR